VLNLGIAAAAASQQASLTPVDAPNLSQAPSRSSSGGFSTFAGIVAGVETVFACVLCMCGVHLDFH